MERVSAEQGAKGTAGSGGPTARDFDLQRRLRKLASELESVQTDVAALSTRARATEGAVSELRLVDARQEVRAVQSRLDELVTQIDEIGQATEEVRARGESARADVGDALENVTARVQRVNARVERLDSRVEDVERGGEALRRESESSQAALATLREVRREIRTLRREVDDLSELRREVASVRRAIAELRSGRDREQPGRVRTRLARLLRALKRGGRRVRRRARVARRKVARVMRRARVRTIRLLRRARAKTRRGLRRIRRRLVGPHLGRLDHHPPKKLRIPRRYRRPVKLVDPPTISIVTPSLNQAAFLADTIKSVLDQRYPRLEYIVQDGGSTDGTLELLERYRSRLHRCESRPDSGQAQAINRGFEHASGEIMAYLNADDLILPGTFAYVGRYFQRHPDVDVVYGHRVLVDEDGMEVGRWVLPRHKDSVLSWADFIPQETLYWRRRLWERADVSLDEDSRFALDWDLILSFRDAGARMVRLPRFLGAFRIHEAQKTSTEMETVGSSEMANIRARIHGRNVTREEVSRNIRGYVLRHVLLQKLYRARLLRY
jgi:glycosyltransferase involved in cell wall biosynthesis/prefoldin subunit 5